MFNILGFQGEENHHINTKNTNDEFNDKKEEMFYNNGKVNLDVGLLDNLTERDKYVIEKSEEEFSQNRKFIRLLPHRDSKKLLDILDLQTYNDYLMLQWEKTKLED